MSENSRKKRLSIAVLAAPALAFGSIILAAPAAVAVPENEAELILSDHVESFENGSSIEDEASDLAAPTVIEELEDDPSAETAAPAESHDPVGSLDVQDPADAADAEGEGHEPAVVNVAALDPQIYVVGEWNNIRPGQTVAISGTGFTPGSEVTLTLNDESFATTTVDPEGAITLSEQIPLSMGDLIDLESEVFELVATDSESGESVTYLLTVHPYYDRLVPEISADRTEAEIGDTVRITVDNADELLSTHVGENDEFDLVMGGTVPADDGLVYGILTSDFERVEGAENPYTFEYTIPATVNTSERMVAVGSESYFEFHAVLTVNPADETTPQYYASWSVWVDIIGEGVGEETAEESSEPELTVTPREISLADFVGDPEAGAGVVHEISGLDADTRIDYTVETPDAIETYSDYGYAEENGDAAFTIYGIEGGDSSVYLGDYTTTVSFEDGEGETQELTASFRVVDPTENGSVAPVVDTEKTETSDDTDEVQQVGASVDKLAKTGANGTQLALLAGGLLLTGGVVLVFANRARLFGRQK